MDERSPQRGRAATIAVVVGLVVTGWFAFASSSDEATDADVVLKVASQRGGTKSLILAADALKGAAYRVEWSEFPSAQTLLESLSAGAVDIGAVGDAPFMFAFAAGAPIKVVQSSRSSGGGATTAVLVPDGSPIASIADLKGAKVATGRGSIGHYLLLRVLEREGLTPADVTLVFLGPGDAKAAFSSGAIDAWVTWGSYVGFALLHDKARVLADGKGVLTGIGFQAATDTAIEQKRPQLEDFLRRLTVAQSWAVAHPEQYAATLAKETGLPNDVALYTVSQASSHAVATDDSVIAEERETLACFVRAGAIAAPGDISGAFDASFNAALTQAESVAPPKTAG